MIGLEKLIDKFAWLICTLAVFAAFILMLKIIGWFIKLLINFTGFMTSIFLPLMVILLVVWAVHRVCTK